METIIEHDDAKKSEPELEPVSAVEVMLRDDELNKCTLRKSTYCCIRSWSLCLNGLEGICSGLSYCCIGLSDLAIGCNKCLEQLDCDGH